MITEESGIAKGIRRIVAVTGHEAHDVTRLAQSLGEKLDVLEVSTGKTKDSGLKAFSVVRPIHPPHLLGQILDLPPRLRNSAKLIFPS